MGYAVRTERFRYVEWHEWETKTVVARELYDQSSDPNEMQNIAEQPGQSAVVRRLAEVLETGWRAALPAKGETGQLPNRFRPAQDRSG